MTDGQIYPLQAGKKRWLLGAGEHCDITLADPCVSNRHCVIERSPEGAVNVRDAESRNGTFVDGSKIEAAELRAGAYLSVGRTTLVAVAMPRNDGNREPPRAIEQLRGQDPVLRTVIDNAIRAGQGECSVLIVGETGTGKELLARVVHEASRRNGGKFVAVNCGAIPRELIGSELFGHEKGSFTGATDSRDGYFVEADGGTLFLDELGELPLEQQPHLLRALESKRVRRIGGTSERALDVRIVAATNRTDHLGAEGSRLRVDLFHRVATVVLVLPPLRERIADLPELVESMLDELAPECGRKKVKPDAWKALATHPWPGNVRELRSAVARAVTLGGDELEASDFFGVMAGSIRRRAHGTTPPVPETEMQPFEAILRDTMDAALRAHGSIRAAAESIGMPKSTFADKAKQFQLFARRRPRLGRPDDDDKRRDEEE
jgi:DNA-binding NtrC family response regulator